MNKVTQVEDKLRGRKQNHTSCQRNKGRNGDISHCENQNSYKECKGFVFKYLKVCHIHTIHGPEKTRAVEHILDGEHFYLTHKKAF